MGALGRGRPGHRFVAPLLHTAHVCPAITYSKYSGHEYTPRPLMSRPMEHIVSRIWTAISRVGARTNPCEGGVRDGPISLKEHHTATCLKPN
jgi:hypothetical protein